MVFGSAGLIALGLGAAALHARNSTPPDATIPAPSPTPLPNGFDLYLAAERAVARVSPPIDATWDTQYLAPKSPEAAARYSLARRNAWLRDSAPAWKLFEQARAAGCVVPGTRGFTSPPVRLDKLRLLMRDKVAASNTFKLRGDWDNSVQSGLDLIEMGHDVGRGNEISLLVGAAMVAIGTRNLEEVPPHLSAVQAQNAARRLEALVASAPKLSDVLREEKAVDESQWIAAWREPLPGKNRFLRWFQNQRPEFEAYDRAATEFLPLADLPYAAHTTWPVTDSAIGIAFRPERTSFNFARFRVAEELLLMRLALRAYRAQSGSYPTKIEALTPKLLAKIPIDPFGRGEALRYRKVGDSYGVWSVGPDGQDDGGQPIPLRPGRTLAVLEPQSSGDVVAAP